MEQIEKTARLATESAPTALDRTKRMVGMLAEIRMTVTDLSAGVARSLETTRQKPGTDHWDRRHNPQRRQDR